MSTIATFKQAGHILTIFDQKELSLDDQQTLIDGGYLADLARAAKEGKISKDRWRRDEVRKTLGLPRLGMYAIQYFGMTLKGMIAEAKFSRVSPEITEERFPKTAVDGRKRYSFEVHQFGAITTKRAIERMNETEFPAACLDAGLAFATAYPTAQVGDLIALLGQSAEIDGKTCFPILGGATEISRTLLLGSFEEAWPERYAFLGAKEIPLGLDA